MARRTVNGEAVRAMRQLLGIDQAELARRCGITQSGLSRIETGKRPASPKVTRALADHLGVNLDAITSPVTEPRAVAS